MSQTLFGRQRLIEASPSQGRGDPVRRAVAILLLVYLSPVLLAVFLVGVLGLGLCAVARWAGRLGLGVGAPRHNATPRPHLAMISHEIPSARR